MEKDVGHTLASRQYTAAHAMHYGTKDLRQAIELYRGVIAAHRDTPEAGYARTQIQNIVNSVVPKQVLLDDQTELALSHIAP